MAEKGARPEPTKWTSLLIVFGTIILTGVWFIYGLSGPLIGRTIHEWGMFWIFGAGTLGAPVFFLVTLALIYLLRSYSLRKGLKRPWLVMLIGVGLWFFLSNFIAEVFTVIGYDLL